MEGTAVATTLTENIKGCILLNLYGLLWFTLCV